MVYMTLRDFLVLILTSKGFLLFMLTVLRSFPDSTPVLILKKRLRKFISGWCERLRPSAWALNSSALKDVSWCRCVLYLTLKAYQMPKPFTGVYVIMRQDLETLESYHFIIHRADSEVNSRNATFRHVNIVSWQTIPKFHLKYLNMCISKPLSRSDSPSLAYLLPAVKYEYHTLIAVH